MWLKKKIDEKYRDMKKVLRAGTHCKLGAIRGAAGIGELGSGVFRLTNTTGNSEFVSNYGCHTFWPISNYGQWKNNGFSLSLRRKSQWVVHGDRVPFALFLLFLDYVWRFVLCGPILHFRLHLEYFCNFVCFCFLALLGLFWGSLRLVLAKF